MVAVPPYLGTSEPIVVIGVTGFIGVVVAAEGVVTVGFVTVPWTVVGAVVVGLASLQDVSKSTRTIRQLMVSQTIFFNLMCYSLNIISSLGGDWDRCYHDICSLSIFV